MRQVRFEITDGICRPAGCETDDIGYAAISDAQCASEARKSSAGYSAAREVIDDFSRRCLLMVLWCMDGIGERVGVGILQAINCAKASVGQGIGIEEEGLIPRLSAVCDTLVQAIAE